MNFTKVDKTLQFALVNQSYDVEETNPLVNTQDPFLDGRRSNSPCETWCTRSARPSLICGDHRYGSPFRYYRARDVLIFTKSPCAWWHMFRTTPLTGQTIVPRTKPMESQPRYVVGFTTLVNRSTYGNDYVLDWNDAESRRTPLFSFPDHHVSAVR